MESREQIEGRLVRAEMQVIQGESRLGKQRDIVARLDRFSSTEVAQQAHALLATFEHAQQANLQERDRLRAELEAHDARG